MKQNLSLIALLCALLMLNTAKAAETEPNNSAAAANTLTLNGSNNGKIALSGDEDWWKVTTTGDGRIDVTLSPLSGRNTYAQLYDNNGTLLFVSQYSTATFTISKDGLTAGTYYVRVVCYYSTDSSSYLISNTLTQPAQANDVEPNGTLSQAKVLPLNGSKTGHIGYYYNNLDDTTDWYKVTTTAEGQLSWTITSANGQNVYAQLYDVNGTTYLAGNYTTGTATYSKDGLAAGTYFIRIVTFYMSEFAPYTLSNTLTPASVANDLEPNGTRAQALNINVGDSAVGHIGYANFNGDDTTDWYKVTTTQDGRIDFTMTSLNGQNVYLQLYDNDGTTYLAGNYTTGTTTYSKDGLAAGTYYLRIVNFYLSEFAPYKIKVNLVTPAQANDPEPDSTRALALNLPVNSTTTGHVNYFYNNHRDSEDWYKVTTTTDGMISLTLTSQNGQNVYVNLFDNNGTTLLINTYTTGTTTIQYDGLTAGTYYVRINTYYTTEWAPYTLSNTLTTYTDVNDNEPNNYYAQARTIPSNGTVTGHVNFFYNGTKDIEDKWKINYTGTSGTMTLLFNQEAQKKTGGDAPTYVQVYKDTAAAPVSSNYYYATSGNINLTGLTQGYYYIRVVTYYASDFCAYSLNNTYTQATKAKVTLVAADTSAVCDSTNSITIKCTKSQAPYTAQLYRYNQPYGTAKTINNSKNFVFSNLPKGNYYVRVFGDGATGNTFGRFTSIELMPKPTGTSTTAIQGTQARLNWAAENCANYFSVQYRKATELNWSTADTKGNTTFYILKNLTVSTKYYWKVAAADSANAVTGLSAYTDSLTFTTAASFAAATQSSNDAISKTSLTDNSTLLIYPNPVKTSFRIQFTAKTDAKLFAVLKDMNGNIVWSKNNTNASALSGTTVDAGNLSGGIYMLQVTDLNGNTITKKVVVSK